MLSFLWQQLAQGLAWWTMYVIEDEFKMRYLTKKSVSLLILGSFVYVIITEGVSSVRKTKHRDVGHRVPEGFTPEMMDCFSSVP